MGQGPDRGGRPGGRARPDLLRLVYVSFASRPLDPADFADIEARSEARNFAHGITGLLIAQGSFFYGLMEGPPRRLFSRMEVIITDDRHKGLRILREETIDVRRFANWSFARLPESRTRPAIPDGMSAFIRDLSRRLA